MKNKMNNLYVIVIFYIFGYLSCYKFYQNKTKITKTEQTEKYSNFKSEVQTHISVKKDQATVKQMIVHHKTYDNSGKLSSETQTFEYFGDITSEKIDFDNKIDSSFLENTFQKKQTDISYKNNLEIGVMTSASSLMSSHQKVSLTLDVGYRLFSDVYARAEINPVTFESKVGLFFLF